MVRRVIEYQLFSVLMVNATGDKLEHRLSVKLGENIQIRRDIPVGEGITGRAMATKEAVVAKDVREDPRYIMVNPDVRSELAVPLIHKGEVWGVLDLEHVKKNYYTERHARTISTLAAHTALCTAGVRPSRSSRYAMTSPFP